MRTRDLTVTFRHPFSLKPLSGPQPAGTYRLTVEDEAIDSLTVVAFRRTATLLEVPSMGAHSLSRRSVSVDQDELTAALAADAELPPPSA